MAWCRKMLHHSPLALRMLKASLNAADDGLAGIQQLAGDATMLFYLTEEAQEGRDAYKDKRRARLRQVPQASVNRWVAGARPRTLPAAVVPVLVGTAAAVGEGDIIGWRMLAALVVSLALQVGTNYANDYSDGVRGTDDERVGPVRLVASELASPAAVKRAAFVAFGVAALAGTALALATRRGCSSSERPGHRRRLVLHRRSEAVRLLRLRRAVRVRVLRPRRHRRARPSCRSSGSPGCRSRPAWPWASAPWPCWW